MYLYTDLVSAMVLCFYVPVAIFAIPWRNDFKKSKEFVLCYYHIQAGKDGVIYCLPGPMK